MTPNHHRFTFLYASAKNATVTVHAETWHEAEAKARKEMDRRYEKANREPPTAWTLRRNGVKRAQS